MLTPALEFSVLAKVRSWPVADVRLWPLSPVQTIDERVSIRPWFVAPPINGNLDMKRFSKHFDAEYGHHLIRHVESNKHLVGGNKTCSFRVRKRLKKHPIGRVIPNCVQLH